MIESSQGSLIIFGRCGVRSVGIRKGRVRPGVPGAGAWCMRVGLVSYEYPPQQGLGGVGTYMFRLAGALGRAGHEVHVITGPSDRPPVQQPNVTIHRIPAAYEMGQSSRVLRWLYWTVMAKPMSRINPTIWYWLKWDLASAVAMRKLDTQYHFDVIE